MSRCSDAELLSIFMHKYRHEDGKLYWLNPGHARIKAGSRADSEGVDGYFRVSANGKSYLAHRVIFLLHHGYLPGEIDHIDEDKSNNSVNNLRPATRFQNAKNISSSRSLSGIKGVKRHFAKWRADIRHEGKNKYLGLFDTVQEAIEARRSFVATYHGEFANNGSGCLILDEVKNG